MGRYISRANLTARFLRVILRYEAEIDNFQDPVDKQTYLLLLRALTHLTMTYPGFVGEGCAEKLANPKEELRSIILDPSRIGGLAHTIRMWKGAANAIRNHWSMDTWKIFDQVDSQWRFLRKDKSVDRRKMRTALDELVNGVAASLGFTLLSLSIEEGLPIFEIGIDLERSMMMASLLRSTLTVVQDKYIEDNLLETVLLNCESLITYRNRYRGFLRLDGVLELTLLDSTYPKSIAYRLQSLQKNLKILPKLGTGSGLREDQKEVLKAYTLLQIQNANQMVEVPKDDMLRAHLDTLLAELRKSLAQSASSIIHTFFAHTSYETQRSVFLFNPDF